MSSKGSGSKSSSGGGNNSSTGNCNQGREQENGSG